MTAPTPADVPGQGEVEGLAISLSTPATYLGIRKEALALALRDWLAERDAKVARRAKAEAWDEGWIVGNRWAFSDADVDAIETNPYCTTETRP